MLEQHFNHKERRFLISPRFIPTVEAELSNVFSFGRTYRVQTIYLDTPERTWSGLTMGEEHPKIRLRMYFNGDTFLEKKLHTKDGQTIKERTPVTEQPEGLIPVGKITYSRTEYQLGDTRVTIDRDVRGSESEIEGPTLASLLIEIKGDVPHELEFLKPFESKKFSKWRFITGRFQECP